MDAIMNCRAAEKLPSSGRRSQAEVGAEQPTLQFSPGSQEGWIESPIW